MKIMATINIIGFVSLISMATFAANHTNLDVVVPLPADIWKNSATSGTNNNSCVRCCTYQNQKYSEGAVLQIERGVLLQCVRDANSAGTNPLVWKQLNK